VNQLSAHGPGPGGLRGLPTRRLALALALGLASTIIATAIAPGTSFAGGADWPVYHGNPLGSGVAAGSSSFHGAKVAWTSRALRGQIFGEPLVEGNEVVVATENDAVYALNATNGGKILWSTRVGTPVSARMLPCGDIHPKVGITSTPVIDPARSEVFVVADEQAHRVISHHLVGLSLLTGRVLLNEVVDPPGTTPSAQLQRAALTLDEGQVVIASGGNAGDCSTYHGWVVAVPETGGAMRTFEVDPTSGNNQGAIWMGGGAPIVDGAGHIWLATGNGSNTSGSDPDSSDSVIELSPTLQRLQFFAPSTWANDNANDFDLGSSPPALLPDGSVFQAGKSQTAFVLDQSALGGVGGQLTELGSFCGADVDGGNAFVGQTVYVPCMNGVMAVQVQKSPPSVVVQWMTSQAPGPPIVADGLVWTIDQNGGVLHGLNPQTGDSTVHFKIGAVANHFPTPSVGDGLLLAPSSNRVHAFTLTP